MTLKHEYIHAVIMLRTCPCENCLPESVFGDGYDGHGLPWMTIEMETDTVCSKLLNLYNPLRAELNTIHLARELSRQNETERTKILHALQGFMKAQSILESEVLETVEDLDPKTEETLHQKLDLTSRN